MGGSVEGALDLMLVRKLRGFGVIKSETYLSGNNISELSETDNFTAFKRVERDGDVGCREIKQMCEHRLKTGNAFKSLAQ